MLFVLCSKMSDALTARQTQILKALIDEYITTAEPVGSESLEKKYSLGVSPATVRNEMFALTRNGYLRQPHTSAGRIPTPKAMKFYIDQLMEERQMTVAEEVKAKEEMSGARNDIGDLLDEATHELAHVTKSLAVATFDDADKIGIMKDKLIYKDLYSLLKKSEGYENIVLYHLGEIIRLIHLASINLFSFVENKEHESI